MTQVFISYSRKDLDFVERLARDLKAKGLEVWYDLSGLEIGTRWGKEIQTAIQQSQYFLVVLSPNSIESEWVEKEYLYASSRNARIIPILYKPCDLPMWFINLHFIDVQGKNYKLHFPELLKALGIEPDEKGRTEESAIKVHPEKTAVESHIPELQAAETEMETPPPLRGQISSAQEPAPEVKAQPPEFSSRKKTKQPRQKRKLRPVWVFLPVGLIGLTAFMVWGIPPLSAILGLPPAASSESTRETIIIPAASPESTRETIIIGVTEPVTSLDPLCSSSIVDWGIITNTSEGLLGYQPGTAELEPVLAEELPKISADGKTYTFTLRPGIKFADGLVLTAPLYVQQINRLLTIEPSAENESAVQMAVPYIESITAPDETTIIFKLKNATAYFSHLLAIAFYSPTHPDTYPADACVQFPTAPIYGVGPWFISQYTRDVILVLEPNPYYSGPYPAQVDQIIMRYFTDQEAMTSAIRNGEIDIAWRALDSEQIPPLENLPGLMVGTIYGSRFQFLSLNHAQAPMDDPNVVKAIASSIDRNAIIETVFDGEAIPLYSMVSPGLLGATAAFDTMYSAPDLEQARQYLEASGYNASNKLEVQLWYPSDHFEISTVDCMELIEQQLEETGVITATLYSQPWSLYVKSYFESESSHPISFSRWGLDYPDSSNVLDPFIYNGGWGNFITSPQDGSTFGIPLNSEAQRLVDLLSDADVETDQAVRAVLYQQAQEIYADLVVTIPLFLVPDYIIYRDTIHGSSLYPTPETLNIGLARIFNYSLLVKDP